VTNCRKVEIRQQTQVLATRSAIVCAENRVLAFMLQNRCLASSAHEAAWGLFKAELAQACANRGHLLLEAPRFAATTQACPTPGCGYINRNLENTLKCRT
jgi:transposase